MAGNRIYVADYEKGLKVFCTVPNVQYMMRVEGGKGARRTRLRRPPA